MQLGSLAASVFYTTYLIETQTWKLCHWPSWSSVRCVYTGASFQGGSSLKQSKHLDLRKWKWLFTKEFTTEFLQIPSSPSMFVVISFTQNFSGTSVLFKARYIYTDLSVNQSVWTLIRASTQLFILPSLILLFAAIGMKQPAVAVIVVLFNYNL